MAYYQNQYAKSFRRPARPLASASSAPRQILAKYPSVCSQCQGPIAVGDAILWSPGQPAVHVECPSDHGIEAPEAEVVFPVAAQAPVRVHLSLDEVGVYVLPDGTVVKAQANREKTRVYAKRWVPSSQNRLLENGAHAHGEYVYEAGLVEIVAREGRKMSLEEAKAHSVLYAQCVRCGRRLTDGKSVEQGMGPVCITYFS